MKMITELPNTRSFEDYIVDYKYQQNTPIKIASIDTYIIKPSPKLNTWSCIKPFLFVKLTTVDNIEGWGEAFTLSDDDVITVNCIHNYSDIIADLDSVTPWYFHELISRDKNQLTNMNHAAAKSSFEMALWDIFGKVTKTSLSHIIGKSVKSSVPVYANIWSDEFRSNKEVINKAKSTIKEGYRAIKIYPLQNRNVNQAAKLIGDLRISVGDDICILLDLACPDDPDDAIKLEPLISAFNPYWYEEPVDGNNIEQLCMIRDQSKFNIVTGESHCGIEHFSALLKAGAAQILNPDIAAVGGIIDMLTIAKAAFELDVKISPHCWNSMTVSAAVMMHLCAIIPNSDMAEIFPDYIAPSNQFSDYRFKPINGMMKILDEPGIGLTMNLEAIRKQAHRTRTTILI